MVLLSSYPGNMDSQVGFDGFQVSNQCMALVRDECQYRNPQVISMSRMFSTRLDISVGRIA